MRRLKDDSSIQIGSRMNSDAAIIMMSMEVSIGCVGQRKYNFADLLSLRYLIDSQMVITRGQYNM